MSEAKKKEIPMQAQDNISHLSLPKIEEKRLVQAEVNLELFDAVSKEMKRRGLKIRQIVEFGLKSYLLSANPKEAAKLGIK